MARVLSNGYAPKTRKFVITTFAQLYTFAVRKGYCAESPDIPGLDVWAGGSGRPVVLGPSQFDAFVDLLREEDTRENRILAVAAIFGRYGGLRADEVARLTLKDALCIGGEVFVYVWRGKSVAARRCVPLHAFAPQAALDIVTHWVKERRAEFRPDAVLRLIGLFGPYQSRDRYTYEALIGNLIVRLKSRFGDGADFHMLRHTFCSWLLLTWYAARHADFPTTLYEGRHPVFEAASLVKLARFFTLGRYDRIPPHSPSDLIMISKLVGHAGLDTFFESYVHTFHAVQRYAVGRMDKLVGERALKGRTIGMLVPKLRSRTSQARLPHRTINCLAALIVDAG